MDPSSALLTYGPLGIMVLGLSIALRMLWVAYQAEVSSKANLLERAITAMNNHTTAIENNNRVGRNGNRMLEMLLDKLLNGSRPKEIEG